MPESGAPEWPARLRFFSLEIERSKTSVDFIETHASSKG